MKAYDDDLKLTPEARYIHHHLTETSDDGNGAVKVIVTMNPFLAGLIHGGVATQHDNTYKRVFGEYKEWEVVLWYNHTQRRKCFIHIVIQSLDIDIPRRCYSCLIIRELRDSSSLSNPVATVFPSH